MVGTVGDRILTPTNLEHVVERALEQIEAQIAGPNPDELRRRLAAVEAKIERAVDLAVGDTGDLAAVKRKLAELRAERDELDQALRAAPPPFDREAFRDLVERRALDLREAFGSAPEECRRALKTLLAGERMRVLSDEASGFRLEGLFRLSLDAAAPGTPEGPGRCDSSVAGGRFATDETGRVPVMAYRPCACAPTLAGVRARIAVFRAGFLASATT